MQPVLVVPDLNKKMRIEVDMSEYTIEGILSMKCKNDKQRPVVFILKLLNKAKRNYEIHN